MKPKILFPCEASILNTGFAVINKEIMSRFYRDGYEVAEIGSYSRTSDPRHDQVPWPVYGTEPTNPSELDQYRSDPQNQFGKHIFESACLDFKPTHVVLSRDPWMDSFVLDSPFRDKFKVLWMSIIDSGPVHREWVYNLERSDMVLCPMEYTKNELDKTGGKFNIYSEFVRPCADIDLFKPLDKSQVRKELGIREDAEISLMVSRNQPRKLFHDLIFSYAKYVNSLYEDKKEKSYLYLSTSWPDVGTDIFDAAFRSGIGSHLLLNYYCRNCGKFKPMNPRGEKTRCVFCGGTMVMPSTKHGLTREQLVKTYNAADLFIQHCTNEGISLTPAEARSCGVPALVPNHTTLPEHRDLIYEVDKHFWQQVGPASLKRFLPNAEDMIECVEGFFCLPVENRRKMGENARKDIEERYNYERSYKIFKDAIDSMEMVDKWNDAPKMMTWNPGIFNGRYSPFEMTQLIYQEIFKDTKEVGSYRFWKMNQDMEKMGLEKFAKEIKKIVDKNNFWEQERVAQDQDNQLEVTVV